MDCQPKRSSAFCRGRAMHCFEYPLEELARRQVASRCWPHLDSESNFQVCVLGRNTKEIHVAARATGGITDNLPSVKRKLLVKIRASLRATVSRTSRTGIVVHEIRACNEQLRKFGRCDTPLFLLSSFTSYLRKEHVYVLRSKEV